MNLHQLSPAPGSKHSPKRVGRGPGSGLGKTAGRGHKGGKSRSGHRQRPGFEGGQMPLIRRVPKGGFHNPFRTEYEAVNLRELRDMEGSVGPEELRVAGLVRRKAPIKILAAGEIHRPLTVRAHRFSKAAKAKIEAAGGRWEEIAYRA